MHATIRPSIEEGRQKLLAAIGQSKDITFFRGYGNLGDELIWAGTRQLLKELPYKEAGILDLDGQTGDTALLAGGGAWCGPFHDMPAYLARLEEAFRRVIVLPSSFDPSVDCVKWALLNTRALVFAREEESYNRIRGLCQAELACDCAFFFDFAPYQCDGYGVLKALRTDAEALPGVLPEGNLDISAVCGSLDEWLWTIARHAEVHTDRAHVMIAAALLGKQVSYRSSSYHKVPSIAAYSLRGLPVRALHETQQKQEEQDNGSGAGARADRTPPGASLLERLMPIARVNLERLPPSAIAGNGEPELTIVMLSYGPLHLTLDALHALREHVAIPFRLLLIDNGSDHLTREGLKQATAGNPSWELILLDRNLGIAAGRMFALARVQTPLLMLLDNDVTVLPGAVEHLVLALRDRPDAVAATGRLIFPDGTIHLCGGKLSAVDGLLQSELIEFGQRYDEPSEPSGVCDWVPGAMTVIRTNRLNENRYDSRFHAYYEDLEWCLRLRRENAVFLRCVESLGIHHHRPKQPSPDLPVGNRIEEVAPFLAPIGILYQEYGVFVVSIFSLVPEIGSRSKLGLLAARLLLQLVHSLGCDWFSRAWAAGELSPLFGTGEILRTFTLERELSRYRMALAEGDRIIASRDQGVEWLRSELRIRVAQRDSLTESLAASLAASEERLSDTRVELEGLIATREKAIEAQDDELAVLRASLKKAEQTRQLTLNRCYQFKTAFEEQLEAYRKQRAWQVMLWCRKAYSLFAGSKLQFLRFALSTPWRGSANLEEYDLSFPLLPNYMPRQIMSPFVGEGEVDPLRGDHDAVYGDLDGTVLPQPRKYDVLILAIIDFDSRFQRPQQIAAQFARSGHRVLWVSPTRFLSPSSHKPYELFELKDGLWEVRLRGKQPDIYLGSLDESASSELLESLRCVYRGCGVVESCTIVQLPFWRRVGLGLREFFGTVLLYDCMDEWETFPNIGPFNITEELLLASECDVLVVTAQKLVEKFRLQGLAPLLVRNASDFEFFAAAARKSLLPAGVPPPVVGYFGAIADWMDLDLVAQVAQLRPHYSFVLIGQVFGIDTSRLAALPNLHLLGHRSYEEIPSYLREFDACVIPFLVNRVTSATDPVKLYEYFSQGKPVVATDMAELTACGDLLYIAQDPADFAVKLDLALRENDDGLNARRIEFARSNTWTHRVELVDAALRNAFPLISILVVTYNSAEFVGPCLDSIFHNATYPNLEIIAVDNASTDDTAQRIRAYEQDTRIRLFCLDENRGFAGGNNLAVDQAAGEYIVFLNPDTMVTAGWLENLLRHLRRDRTIGLLTAVTNFAGNEVKINVDYRNQREMETFAAYVTKAHFGESFDVRVAPLYCAIMPKQVWERVGALDERFKMGMFEDDDLSIRVRAAGLRVAAAHDCFIHHFGQGSFSKLSGEEYGRIFERNRLAFEAKWNRPWEPHQPADGVRPAHDEERFVPSAFCDSGRRLASH